MDPNFDIIQARLASIEDPRQKIELLNRLAQTLQHGNLARAIALSEKARQLAASDATLELELAYSLDQLATLYMRQSDFEHALHLALEARVLFQRLESAEAEAKTLGTIGMLHFHMGNYPAALKAQLVALRLSQTASDPLSTAELLNNIGLVHMASGDLKEAERHLSSSLELTQQDVGYGRIQAAILDNLGRVRCRLGDYERALECEQRSLELSREHGLRQREVEALHNLGTVYRESDRVSQALPYFEQSLALAQEIKHRPYVVMNLLEIGQVLTVQLNAASAVSCLYKALGMAEDMKARQQIADIHFALSAACEQSGDWEQALTHYKNYHALRQQIFNERADNRLKSLQIAYEIETAHRETEIYQLRNVALQHEIDQKEQLIGELDAFAGTVAHDLKSPIASMTGYGELLKMQLSEVALSDDVRQLLNDLLQMGYKAGRIIDSLLTLSTLRREDVKLEPLDMAAIMAEVEARLTDLVTEYQAEISRPAAWPCALGFAPWIEEVWFNYISNAIKYGGSPPHVALGAGHQADGQIRFWVRDNGDGLSLDKQAQLFNAFIRLDFSRAEGYGLGLSIVKRIVMRLGGVVAVESAGLPGQGSTFSFTLPAAT